MFNTIEALSSQLQQKIEVRKITHTQIHNAVYRAEQRDKPPCPSWPRSFGSTTVYRLVRKILKN